MIDPPLTKKDASKLRYGTKVTNPKGNPYNPERCAWEVWASDGWSAYQCMRKNGHGPSSLYCKQHAKMVEDRASRKWQGREN